MKRHAGFSLIEVLVATVILAFGILGMSYMQVYSLRNTSVSNNIQLASIIVNSLAEQMRFSTNTNSDLTKYTTFIPSSSTNSTCDTDGTSAPDEIYEINICKAFEAISRLRNGTLTIVSSNCGGTCSGVDDSYTITASWGQQTESGLENSSYSVHIIPPKKQA